MGGGQRGFWDVGGAQELSHAGFVGGRVEGGGVVGTGCRVMGCIIHRVGLLVVELRGRGLVGWVQQEGGVLGHGGGGDGAFTLPS